MLKHAFMICVHKDFELISMLISTLRFGDVYIHVDAKNDDLYNQLKMKYKGETNVYLVENRVNVNWSGFSQVRSTLEMIKTVKQSNETYDYIHYISGQDLLLYNKEMFDHFFEKNGLDKEYIDCLEIGNYRWRVNCYNLFGENKNNRKFVYRIADNILRIAQRPIIRRKNLKGFNLYKGSCWFSITHDCMNYILEVVNTTDYIDKFKYTACSDEHFFQILIMNSKFKENVIKNNYRYVSFPKMASSPIVLTMKDYEDFMNGKYLFARKFDRNIDEEVIRKVIDVVSDGGNL